MTPERWAQVDQLLATALELSGAERAAFLAEACGEDVALRHEVESLLRAHHDAETAFLTTPPFSVVARELAEQHSSGEAGRFLIGQTLGHYSLLSVLGVGGMGEVYLARDERMNRRLALKILPPRFVSDDSRVERFAREARAVSALNHPNIVTVYEIGQFDGAHFIAMEHVDGQTLREKIHEVKQQPSDVKEVVEIALQISAALSAAHAAGIIHRDIKPENVMLRRDDYVKVVDFGLAKLIEPERSLAETLAESRDLARTNPGTVLGTVRYMSPEQAQGESVDARSDLFSLGVVLYELLTGSTPFKGDTVAATLDAVVHHTPIPLTQLLPDVPADCAKVIHRMLEKDRERRYSSADELRAALRQVKRELDSPSTNSSAQGDKHSVRRVITSPLNTVALLAVLAMVAFVVWRFWPAKEPEPSSWFNAYSRRLTHFPGEERNPSLSPDGNGVYYARRVDGQWDIFWQSVSSSKPINLTQGNDADDTQPACSPKGSRVVFRSERDGGGLFMMGAMGENVQRVSRYGHNPSWSPDGTQIVCGTDYILHPKQRGAKSQLVIFDIATGQERTLTHDEDSAQPRWSPGGKRIAFFRRTVTNRRDIWTIAVDGSDPRPVTNDDATDWNPVWSGDGQYLYFTSDRQAAASVWRVRIDEATGRTLAEPEPVTGPAAEVSQMDLSANGRRIVYTTRVQDANIKAIEFDPIKLTTIGTAEPITEGTTPSGSPSLSPDGEWLAFHTLGAPQEDIWLKRADGSGPSTNLTNDAEIDRSPSWSPDGKRLAFFSTSPKFSQIWLINPDGSGKRQLTFAENGSRFPFWAFDGKRLAYHLTVNTRLRTSSGSHKGGTQIIEVDKPWTEQTPVSLPPVNEAGDWFEGYHWSRDGKYIAGHVVSLQGQETRTKPGLYVYSFETHRYEQITDIGLRMEWLADNRHILFNHAGKRDTAERQIGVVDTQTKIIKWLISHPTQIISTFGLTRDNRRLFYTATDHQGDIFLLSLDK